MAASVANRSRGGATLVTGQVVSPRGCAVLRARDNRRTGPEAPLRVTFLLPFCALTVLAAAQHARAPAEHWSYRPVVRPALPTVADAAWCRSPLDQLVL